MSNPNHPSREWLDAEHGYLNLMLPADMDDALIGIVALHTEGGIVETALYDRARCIKILMRDGMAEEEANEYFDFNVGGAYVGEGTPAFATLLVPEES